MKTEDTDTLTTSFLDVITCGLGSILLLFFLMVAIKGEMQFTDSPAEVTPANAVGKVDAPFILMVTSANGKPIWAPDVEQPWRNGTVPFVYSESRGASHAILYAGKSPPPGWSAKVGPVAPQARVTVEVIADGQRVAPWTNVEVKSLPQFDGEYLSLWPLPKGKKK